MKVNRRELFEERRVRSGSRVGWRVVASSKKLFGQDVLLNLPDLPSPANSGIEHIVVVTMEKPKFDIFWDGCRMRRASKQG